MDITELKAIIDANIFENTSQAITGDALNDVLNLIADSLGEYVPAADIFDEAGTIRSALLPSYVDDVLEFSTRDAFPPVGEGGKIYLAADTNLSYRWGGSEYVIIAQSLALGETSSTAYRGDRGKIAYDHSQTTHSLSIAGMEVSALGGSIEADALASALSIPELRNDLTTVSTALQSLQSQIDSIANRKDFDEINAGAVFADNLSARRVLTGEFIQIGNAVISWDAEHDCLKVDKGLYSTSFLSSAGFSNTGGAGGGTVVGATVGGKEVTLSGGILEFDAYPTTTSLGLKALAFKDSLAVADIVGLQSALSSKQDAATAITTSNYNSYAPKLDGTGATGTWGINISGNAATSTNATYATYDNSGEQIAGNFTKVSKALQSLQSQIDSIAGAKGDEVIAAVVSSDIVTAQNAYIAVMHGSLDGNATTATNATYAAYDNSGEHIADNFSKVGAALKSLQSQIDSVASRDFAELSETLLSLKLWIEDMFTLTSSGIRTKYNFYTEGNLASGKAN